VVNFSGVSKGFQHDWCSRGTPVALGVASVLYFFGFIHAGKVAWSAAPHIALGYLLLSVFFVLFGLVQRRNAA
jgi:AGZA family xanthine/uracil permease-like MFS transporter